MSTLAKAILIAAQAHLTQMEDTGLPYVLHPLRIMMQMKSEEEMIVAVLHDVVEDSDWTIDKLRNEGFSERILKAVDSLTKRDGELYDDFIDRTIKNKLALRVKIGDLQDNMDIKRIKKLTKKDLIRLEKYHKAWKKVVKQESK